MIGLFIRMSRIFAVYTAVLLVLQGCSALRPGEREKETLVIFPSPPDSARIQYLCSISSSIDITGKRSGFKRYVMGEEQGKPIHKPYGIRVHGDKLYICDTMLPGLEIIDLKAKTFRYFNPGGFGALMKPVNCTVDENGYLYVADAERKQVVVFDSAGEYLNVIGQPALVKPTDVYAGGGELWVCDLDQHRIIVFDTATLNVVRSFPESDQGSPQYLYSPTNIAIRENHVYVTDTGDSKLKVFDAQGRFLMSIGTFGRNAGEFVRPKGVDVDKNGIVYAVDAAFENVQMFDESGRLLMFFGGPYKHPGNMYLPAGLTIDYATGPYFERFVDQRFKLEFLIYVTNQYGPDKVNVYGFVSCR